MDYTVIYRTGGTERFEWRKCFPFGSWLAAVQQQREMEQMGYKAIIHRTFWLERIGLPETWD